MLGTTWGLCCPQGSSVQAEPTEGGLLLALPPRPYSGLASPGPLPTQSPDRTLPSLQVVAVYNLTLQVADMSGDGLTATASAIITLEDVNDNAPEFTRDEVPPLSTPHQPLLGLPFPPQAQGEGGRLGALEKESCLYR